MTNRVHVTTFLVVLVLAALAQAQTFTTLYNFDGTTDGEIPIAGVIQDSAGNLYGTTYWGGNPNHCRATGGGCGVVYEVNAAGTQTVLHSFSGLDGEMPDTPLVRDGAGNLYGTTQLGGGSSQCSSEEGCGVVFKLDTAGKETVLHNFTGGADGCIPSQGLVMDNAANLYGTTLYCGFSNYGTIFKIDNAGNFTVLYSFTGSDGANPEGGHLTMDESGNLYGATAYGGSTACSNGGGCGVLFELSESGTYAVLHRFAGGTADGCQPNGSVVMDLAGNLYGTTVGCGSSNKGTIWKVSKKGQKTILHNFAGGTSDGCWPLGGVTRNSKGSLYGVSESCGTNNEGALYELTANGKFALLHSFDGSDGSNPTGELLPTTSGILYGTADNGGPYGAGTVWSYSTVMEKTTTTLASSPNPSTVGQDVTFTATITAANGQTPNDGTVTFKYGTTVLATANVSSGVAQFDTTTLPVGKHTITATYSGDSTFQGGTGKDVQVVNKN
jgi:uncharacterized repeat protein (TIGR03803 family)